MLRNKTLARCSFHAYAQAYTLISVRFSLFISCNKYEIKGYSSAYPFHSTNPIPKAKRSNESKAILLRTQDKYSDDVF